MNWSLAGELLAIGSSRRQESLLCVPGSALNLLSAARVQGLERSVYWEVDPGQKTESARDGGAHIFTGDGVFL